MLNKNLAGFFAFFFGIFGVHYFYVGKWWKGALQFAAFWFFVFLTAEGDEAFGVMIAATAIIPFITALLWWSMPTRKWQQKFDPAAVTETPPLLGAAPSGDVKALKAEGIRYYRSADYDLAVEAFLEAAEVDPADPGTHFNLACAYAQLGQYPEALRYLELTVTFGLPGPERIEKHPALAGLRQLPEFASFRANNYRRLRFTTAEAPPPAKAGETPSAPAEPPATALPELSATEDYTRPTPPAADLLEQISRLRELHDAGVLTQGEYQKQKEKLLG